MSAVSSRQQATDRQTDGRADFDFFIGSWKVRNRVLRERLKGSTAWEEFPSATVAQKILGGMGNFEEYTLERASGTKEAIAIRFFDPRSQQWSIYGADGVNGLDPKPMIGEFKGGRGEFYSQEPFEGRSILVRVIWSDITTTSCHWEQAFSADGGRTWETNWISDFERTA